MQERQCVDAYGPLYMCRSENNFWDFILSFHYGCRLLGLHVLLVFKLKIVAWAFLFYINDVFEEYKTVEIENLNFIFLLRGQQISFTWN